MRVLVVSRSSPFPCNSGRAQRTAALIRALAIHHDVTLCCPLEPELRPSAQIALGSQVRHFAWVDPDAAIARSLPASGSRLARLAAYLGDFFTHSAPYAFRQPDARWQTVLQPLLQTTDAVLCRYNNVIPLVAGFDRQRIVVDVDDLLFLAYWQAAWSGEQGFGAILCLGEALRSYLTEQFFALRCARALVVSTQDRRRLWTRTTVLVPNGVTFETVAADAPAEERRMLFVGDCRWQPNVVGLRWFIASVWPSIRTAFPDATLAIVGRSATAAALPFAVAPGIELAADVPTVIPWLESATTAIVPLFQGAGTRIKIVEAIGYGVPVVSTPVGAAGLTDRLDATQGLFVAEDAPAMIATITRIFADPARYRSAAAAGRDVVRHSFSWDVTTGQLAEKFGEWIPRVDTATDRPFPVR